MLEDRWLRQNNLFTKAKKYPTDCLPSPEVAKLLCKLGGGHGELLQGELLRRPCAAGGVRAPGDLPLREGPPHGFLLLKARAEGHVRPGAFWKASHRAVGISHAKERHLRKPSSGFVPGRSRAPSSIPPVTERAGVRNKERVARQYSQV